MRRTDSTDLRSSATTSTRACRIPGSKATPSFAPAMLLVERHWQLQAHSDCECRLPIFHVGPSSQRKSLRGPSNTSTATGGKRSCNSASNTTRPVAAPSSNDLRLMPRRCCGACTWISWSYCRNVLAGSARICRMMTARSTAHDGFSGPVGRLPPRAVRLRKGVRDQEDCRRQSWSVAGGRWGLCRPRSAP